MDTAVAFFRVNSKMKSDLSESLRGDPTGWNLLRMARRTLV
jgi:hypothetical protein